MIESLNEIIRIVFIGFLYLLGFALALLLAGGAMFILFYLSIPILIGLVIYLILTGQGLWAIPVALLAAIVALFILPQEGSGPTYGTGSK